MFAMLSTRPVRGQLGDCGSATRARLLFVSSPLADHSWWIPLQDRNDLRRPGGEKGRSLKVVEKPVGGTHSDHMVSNGMRGFSFGEPPLPKIVCTNHPRTKC